MSGKSVLQLYSQYQTEIPGIDAQHRELFFMIDGFLENLKEKNARAFLNNSIDKILDHLTVHFSTEESLIDMIGFPNGVSHKNQHREIMNQVTEVIKTIENMDNEQISRLVRVFRDVALTHIAVNDNEYVTFIDSLMHLRKKFSITALKARAIAE